MSDEATVGEGDEHRLSGPAAGGAVDPLLAVAGPHHPHPHRDRVRLVRDASVALAFGVVARSDQRLRAERHRLTCRRIVLTHMSGDMLAHAHDVDLECADDEMAIELSWRSLSAVRRW